MIAFFELRMLFTWEKCIESFALHLPFDAVNGFSAPHEKSQMICDDELFTRRSLAFDTRLRGFTDPNSDIIVRQPISFFRVHDSPETERFEQSLVEFLRLAQTRDLYPNMTHCCARFLFFGVQLKTSDLRIHEYHLNAFQI